MRLQKISRTAAALLLAGLAGTAFGWAQAKDIPKHGPAVVLFDGKDLGQFDTFLKATGLNADPTHVFQVENGLLHVSGKDFGFVITKQEYKNYYLRAEFKWGEDRLVQALGDADRRRQLLVVEYQSCSGTGAGVKAL